MAYTLPTISPLELPDYADPTAGEQTIETVPNSGSFSVTYTFKSGYVYVLLIVRFSFGTDGVAGNRYATITFKDGQNRILTDAISPGAQPASTGLAYNFVTTLAYAIVHTDADSVVPMPPLVMYPGFSISPGALGHDVGDAVTSVILTYVRYPTSYIPGVAPPPAPIDTSQLGSLAPVV